MTITTQPEALLPGAAPREQQPPQEPAAAGRPVRPMVASRSAPSGQSSEQADPPPSPSMKRLVKQHVTQGVAQGAFGIRKKKPAPMAQKPFPDNVDPDIPDIVNAWRWFQTVDADDSGILEQSEVAQLNHLLGLDWSRRRTKQAYEEMCAMTPYGGREGVSFEDFAAWSVAPRPALPCVVIATIITLGTHASAACMPFCASAGGRGTRRLPGAIWRAPSRSCSCTPTRTAAGYYQGKNLVRHAPHLIDMCRLHSPTGCSVPAAAMDVIHLRFAVRLLSSRLILNGCPAAILSIGDLVTKALKDKSLPKLLTHESTGAKYLLGSASYNEKTHDSKEPVGSSDGEFCE
jgi:hypothetical protein